MNLNSAHQFVSKWTMRVTPGVARARPLLEVRSNGARFMRKAFGSASQMRVRVSDNGVYLIEVRTEGTPAHDPGVRAYLAEQLAAFFVSGFGIGTEVAVDVTIEAGDQQDGKPPAQLLMLPTVSSTARIFIG